MTRTLVFFLYTTTIVLTTVVVVIMVILLIVTAYFVRCRASYESAGCVSFFTINRKYVTANRVEMGVDAIMAIGDKTIFHAHQPNVYMSSII